MISITHSAEDFRRSVERDGALEQSRVISGRRFVGVDGVSKYDDPSIGAYLKQYTSRNFQQSNLDPDVSRRVIIRAVEETCAKLTSVAGSKYSYAQLDDFTDFIERSLLGMEQTSRVERKGVLPQPVYLNYPQERLASYGLQLSDVGRILQAPNITLPGGTLEADASQIQIDPSGQFEDASSIGNVIAGAAIWGAPIYLHDLVQISRGYQSPANYLNFYS